MNGKRRLGAVGLGLLTLVAGQAGAEPALADPAFDSADEWTGSGGISWLHRWALTRSVPKAFFAGEPKTPGWVMDLAGIESE